MEIVETFPPNIELIELALGKQPNSIFTYSGIIYNPSKRTILRDIHIHEEVHQKQQGENADAWYARYLTDKDFRLECEIEAYGEQYKFAKEHVHDTKLLKWALESMAFALSGKEYGSLVTYGQAESKIRNYQKS